MVDPGQQQHHQQPQGSEAKEEVDEELAGCVVHAASSTGGAKNHSRGFPVAADNRRN
jgi:hypothetical protein